MMGRRRTRTTRVEEEERRRGQTVMIIIHSAGAPPILSPLLMLRLSVMDLSDADTYTWFSCGNAQSPDGKQVG